MNSRRVWSYEITHLEEMAVLVLDAIGPPCTVKHSMTVSPGDSDVMPHSTGCKPAFGTLDSAWFSELPYHCGMGAIVT